jgi:two-component system response regulator VicR
MTTEPAAPQTRILVVEDDPAILVGLHEALRLEGYEVLSAIDGEQARERIADNRPDLIVLDLMLPKLDGFGVLHWLRKRQLDVPVLILSAKGRQEDKVRGLKAGADDYLAKPFGLQELLARIEALLRRSRGDQPIRFGQITVDPAIQRVTRNHKPVELSRKELDILLFLARHRNHTVSRDQILDAAWGLADSSSERAVDYHILHLRRKLEPDPSNPQHLITHHGIGYELRDEPLGQ